MGIVPVSDAEAMMKPENASAAGMVSKMLSRAYRVRLRCSHAMFTMNVMVEDSAMMVAVATEM